MPSNTDPSAAVVAIRPGRTLALYPSPDPACWTRRGDFLTQVAATARAVVLAGGTLAPVADMAQQLFPAAVAAGRLTTLSW